MESEVNKLQPGMELSMPILVQIRVTKCDGLPGAGRSGEKAESPIARALRMVDEVKKAYPKANIHVEVEV